MPDHIHILNHIHILISIPPKHSASTVVRFLKGKSSIWFAQNINNKQRNFVGHKFWAMGYCASTVEADEKIISSLSKTKKKKTNLSTTCLTDNK
jgi:putative transposase